MSKPYHPAPSGPSGPSAPSTPSLSSRILSPSPGPHSPVNSLRALELAEAYPMEENDGRPKLGRMQRSSTMTTFGGFDFREGLLPLTLSGEEESEVRAHEGDEKHMGMLHGMALVVGMQVGSGIFSSPGVVVAEVGSVSASLVVWVISGLLAWTGASSFAELGCAIPLSGGAQAYLAYAFGPMLSYLYTWTAVSTLKPGGSAIIALIFGEYINRMIYHAIHPDPEAIVPEWTFKLTALIAIIIVSILNLISRTMGTNFSVILTTIKIGSLIFVFVLGVIYLLRNGPGDALASGNLFEGSSGQLSSYAIALYSGLWAFDGWDQCNFVAGEMKNPNRDLPRALHSSMLLVLILFLGANIAYFVVLDPITVASSNTVALDFGAVTIGKLGAVVFSTLVAISCFGALSNGFYTTASLIYSASRDHFLPEIFARLNYRRRTPDNAMALQAALTSFYVVFGGGFRTLLNFFSVTSWTFYLLTVMGLLVLRIKEPHLDRPYRTWLITPIIFCVVASFLLLMPIFAAPWEALAACVFMFAGVPMYYLTAHSRASSANKTPYGGIRETIHVAKEQLQEDLIRVVPISWLPSSWRRSVRVGAGSGGRRISRGEERVGMLRDQQVEMSER